MVLGLLLSDDVPDAGVQEHVLVLEDRKWAGVRFVTDTSSLQTNPAICLKRS